MTDHEILLAGCHPLPLASYLKAIAILRLVSEQAEPGARGRWHEDEFVLTTRMDRQALVTYLLERYRPTPILAPWNGGSGFYPKDRKTGIDALRGAGSERFSEFREAIHRAEEIVAGLGLQERPKHDAKHGLLQLLRASLPDAALAWLDAAVLLTDDSLRFPPLLGTGGNDGHLDFTNNFMQRLVELFEPKSGRPAEGAEAFLRAALFDEPVPGLPRISIGQFDPAGTGGPNATTGFLGSVATNPWDYVLMLEGAVAFAAAATRRSEVGGGSALSYPFTVLASGAGSGVAALGDETTARGEIWLPLWERPAGYPELRALLAEGRATLGRRPARDGLDFARAIAGLGVDRGIDAFERYAFLMRNGRAYLATPEGRMRVRWSPLARLLDDLDRGGWWGRLRKSARRSTAPAALRQIVRRLEDAGFALTRNPSPLALQEVLAAVGAAHAYLGRSRALQEEIAPFAPLGPKWVREADDGSHEVRLAAALAALAGPPSRILENLFPLQEEPRGRRWSPDSRAAVWGAGSLVSNLSTVARRRDLDRRFGEGSQGAHKPSQQGTPKAGQPPRIGADVEAVAVFLGGATDDTRIAELLLGMALARPTRLPARRNPSASTLLPAGYAYLKLLFLGRETLVEHRLLPAGGSLPMPPRLIELLRSGRHREALEFGLRRLRSSGVRVRPVRDLQLPGCDSLRLLAALLVPLDDRAVDQLVGIVAAPAETAVPQAPST